MSNPNGRDPGSFGGEGGDGGYIWGSHHPGFVDGRDICSRHPGFVDGRDVCSRHPGFVDGR